MAEKIDGPGDRIVLCDLEARVDRLHDQAVSMNGVVDSSQKATRKSSKTGNGALDAEAPEDDPQKEGTGESRWEPVPDEEAGVREGPPLELTQMIAGAGEMKDLGSGAAGVVENGAVQDIFKRVSMITGRLRET